MAWVAGADVTTGDLITAATWNNYLGATGSIEYLKTETDKLDDVGVSDVTGSRAVDGTEYTNGAKIRIAIVTFSMNVDGYVRAYIGAASPPATTVGYATYDDTVGYFGNITFVIPPSYYYKVDDVTATGSLQSWLEHDLH